MFKKKKTCCEKLVEPLKVQCDRDWSDETPEQVVVIACNGIYWRGEELRKVLQEAIDWNDEYQRINNLCGDAEIVGVDIKPQPRYPFTFVLGDAMTYPLEGFDFIWASPPCQDHMQTPHRKHGTGWMLEGTRARLAAPWVIENVPGAPLRRDYVLCGCHFNLPHLRRKRIFETSGWGAAIEMSHDHSLMSLSVVGHGTPSWVRKKWGRCPTIAEYRRAMGIDWMNRDELSQAVPPAYSEYIARQYSEVLHD